jgi:hypothetical protein
MIVEEPARIRDNAGGALVFEAQPLPSSGLRVRWLDPNGPNAGPRRSQLMTNHVRRLAGSIG